MKLQRPDPGIDAAKSGLHGKAGIFFNAGLLEKGEPRFDLQDLDPYLVFDSRESMLGTLENPTLDLDPATPSTLDVITATRAGIATYTDPDGNIATASADTVRVDYTQGAELTPTKFQNIGYTDFSSGWAAQSGVAAQVADDYQGNAVKRLTFDGVTTGGIYQTSINTIGGVSYTGSFYIRRISGSTPLYMRHGFSASGNQTAISVTTEWQRFSVTMLGASGGGNVYFGILQFGAGDDVYEITQPQLEEGTTATTFVENTTGSPKFITGATYGPRVPMILVEPSATNILTHSEDFGNSVWKFANTGSSTVVDAAEAPNGTTTADAIIENTASSNHRIMGWNSNWQMTSGTDYTFSVFLKPNGRNKVQLSGSGLSARLFDLRGTDSQMERLADGWVRCFITGTATVTGVFSATVYMVEDTSVTYTGDGTSGVYIWGAQLEAGSVATSYIPTSGSTVTRAADDLVISGSDFSDFYNQSEGTFYVESVPNENTSASFLFDLTKTSGNEDRVIIYNEGSNQRVYLTASNTNWVNKIIGTRPAGGVFSRVAISYETNNVQASLDGVNMVPDTSATMSTTIAKMTIGNRFEDPHYLNGRIRRLIFWPYSSDRL